MDTKLFRPLIVACACTAALRKGKAEATCSYILKRLDILDRAVNRVEAK